MAQASIEKVMNEVERRIKEDPNVTTTELYEDMTKKYSDVVGSLTIRQFNARFPLQVKRKLAPSRPRKTGARRSRSMKASEERRTKIEKDLHALSQEITSALAEDDLAKLVEIGGSLRTRAEKILQY